MTNQEKKRQTFLKATAKREEKIERKLLEIAMDHNYGVNERGDLETRNSDTEDFLDVSVWGLKRMLREAYEYGKLNG